MEKKKRFKALSENFLKKLEKTKNAFENMG